MNTRRKLKGITKHSFEEATLEGAIKLTYEQLEEDGVEVVKVSRFRSNEHYVIHRDREGLVRLELFRWGRAGGRHKDLPRADDKECCKGV